MMLKEEKSKKKKRNNNTIDGLVLHSKPRVSLNVRCVGQWNSYDESIPLGTLVSFPNC